MSNMSKDIYYEGRIYKDVPNPPNEYTGKSLAEYILGCDCISYVCNQPHPFKHYQDVTGMYEKGYEEVQIPISGIPLWVKVDKTEYDKAIPYMRRIIAKPLPVNQSVQGEEVEYTRDDMESVVRFTKNLEYMDGTKPQYEFTPKEIVTKFIGSIKK